MSESATLVPTLESFRALLERVADLERRLAQLEQQPLALEWITPAQAGELLQCSKPTIARMCADGRLDASKGERAVRIRLESVRAYLTQRRFNTDAIDQRVAEMTPNKGKGRKRGGEKKGEGVLRPFRLSM